MTGFGRFAVVVLVVTIALSVGDLLWAALSREGAQALDVNAQLWGSLSIAILAVTVLGVPIGFVGNRLGFSRHARKMAAVGAIAGVAFQLLVLNYIYDFPNGDFAFGPVAIYLILSLIAGGMGGFVWSRMKHGRPG